MADYFTAISEDGVRFKLNQDNSWEPDITPMSKDGIRFRSSNWGDSVSQVIAAEQEEPRYGNSDAITYEVNVGGLPALSHFYFTKGMLHQGIYGFTKVHIDNNLFFSDFESLSGLLRTKYGEPVKVDDFWESDYFKDNYDERGRAVELGHHSICITWDDAGTTLQLQLAGYKNQIMLNLVYKSKRFQSLAYSEDAKKMLVGL
jgi:hypothetical protein